MLNKFMVLYVDHDGEWMDIVMIDTYPKGRLREWRLSFSTRTKHYYSVLLRGDIHDGPFHTSINLPKAMTDKLWYLAAPHIALARIEGKF